MKRLGTRIPALTLTLAMLLTVLPSLLKNTPEKNREILGALTELAGSKDEAQRYYGVSSSTISPKTDAGRAQVATMLMRYGAGT